MNMINRRLVVFLSTLLLLFCASSFSVIAYADEVIFAFDVSDSENIQGQLGVIGGSQITVDWGDGTQDTFSSGTHSFSKAYDDIESNRVSIYSAEETALRLFVMTSRDANIKFDLGGLPAGLKVLRITGGNTITGDIADLPQGLERIDVYGDNTVTGDISDFPSSLKRVDLRGSSNLSGNLENIPENLLRFQITGDSTLTGDVAELPRDMVLFAVYRSDYISGDIADLPENLTTLVCFHGSALRGDVKDLPAGLTRYDIHGESIIKGNTADLPRALTFFRDRSTSRLTGDIADLPQGLDWFWVDGENTVTGDVYYLPEKISILYLGGQNRISSYSPGRQWKENMQWVEISPSPGNGLSREEVDRLLNDLSGTSWNRPKRIRLLGSNASRSQASDEAVEKLVDMGVSVIVLEDGEETEY